MKIICSDVQEYKELMQASLTIHYHGSLECPGLDPNDDQMMINTLAHLYLTKSDWPNKHEYISIETGENVYEIDEEILNS